MSILNNIVNAKVGSKQVERIYFGADVVWERINTTLDAFPNAAVAYSLRLLRKDYTGAAIRVRRGSDNAEQDIGFVDGEFDLASLTNFIGGGRGWVRTWYDQSGNGRNAVNINTSMQPYIIYDGVLNTINGFPCVRFDDTNPFFANDMIALPPYHASNAPYLSNHFVGCMLIDGNYPYFISTNQADRGFELGTDASTRKLRVITMRSSGVGQIFGSVLNIGQGYILSSTCDRNTLAGYINGVLDVSGADNDSDFIMPSNYWLGNQSTLAVEGVVLIAEFIAYARDTSGENLGIATSMNRYYELY